MCVTLWRAWAVLTKFKWESSGRLQSCGSAILTISCRGGAIRKTAYEYLAFVHVTKPYNHVNTLLDPLSGPWKVNL